MPLNKKYVILKAMNKLTNVDGWINLILYGVIMTAFIVYKTKPDQDKDEHILANRKVSTLWGSFSVAVTWIWAPAIFVCGQKAFEEGLAGIFWFTLPNILCFFVFAPIGVKIRKLMPNAYSLPDFIYKHFHGHRGAHLSYVIVSIGIQISAIVINSLAGGLLLESLCGMNRYTVTVAISAIGLIYSVWRGLPASIITDFVQMIFILFIVFIIALWIVIEGGGINSLTHGLSGISGSSNIFNPWIAYSFGIPASIALITFPVADQMMFQRVMASRQKDVIKTFYYGGLIFGIVPVLLSLLSTASTMTTNSAAPAAPPTPSPPTATATVSPTPKTPSPTTATATATASSMAKTNGPTTQAAATTSRQNSSR